MAEKFDPYYKWLGIPPKDQPPHHYRLLGIELFEPDRDVIDAAANRLMGYLKELAAGDDALYSQNLLNEITRARLCLLNKEKRAAYDQELREKLEAEDAKLAAAAPETPPPPQLPPAPTPPSFGPPVFPAPPQVVEPPQIDIGAAAAPLPSRVKPPSLNVRGGAAPGVREPPGRGDENEGERERLASPQRSSKVRMYVAIGSLAALGIFAILITVVLLPPADDVGRSRPSRDGPTARLSGPRPVLTLVLTEQERSEISEFLLDDQPQPLPPQSQFTLDAGRYRVLLRRPGYQEVFDSITLVQGVHREYRPRWRRDFTAAVPAGPKVVLPRFPPQGFTVDPEPHETSPASSVSPFELPPETMPPASDKPSPAREQDLPEIPQPPAARGSPSATEFQAAAADGFSTGFGQMVAHWPFDDDVGARSGGRHDGTLIGEAQYVEGHAGRALRFSHPARFEVGNSILHEASEFSLGLWMNLESLPAGDGRLISGERMVLFLQGGLPRMEISGHKPLPGPGTHDATGGFQGADLSASLGNWVHLGLSYSARFRQLHYYVNGEHRGWQQYKTSVPASWGRTLVTGLSGALDDLRVFNYRLSGADFRALVEGRFQPPPAPPRKPDGRLVCKIWYDVEPQAPGSQLEQVLRREPNQTGVIEEQLSFFSAATGGTRLACIQGFLFPPERGEYALVLESSGQATLYLHHSKPDQDTLQEVVTSHPGQVAASPRIAFEARRPRYFRILHFYQADSGGAIRMGWKPPGSDDRQDAILSEHFGSYPDVR